MPLEQVKEFLQEAKERIVESEVGQAFTDCLDPSQSGGIPSFPIINPIDVSQGVCADSLFLEVLDAGSTADGTLPDNPSQQPDPRPDIDTEPEVDPNPIPPPPPTKQPPVTIDPPSDDEPIKPKPAPDERVPRTPPTIPPRRLSPATDFTQEENLSVLIRPTLSIKSSATDRVYNCMLHNPVTDRPEKYFYCKVEPPGDKERRKQISDFIIYQIEKIKGDDLVVKEDDESADYNREDFTRDFSLVYLPNTGLSWVDGTKEYLDFGGIALEQIVNQFRVMSRNAYQSVDGLAHVSFEQVDCSDGREIPELDGEGGRDITRHPNFPGGGDIGDGCFVPVSRFKNNEPPSYGMKTQLQVIYKQKIEGKLYEKQLTIPSPLPVDEIDDNDIKNVFPDELEFGELKAETKIIPYGYLKFYATEKEQADNLFDDIINNLVNGQEAETDNSGQSPRKFSQRSRSFVTGTFNLDRAFYFDFNVGDGEPPVCKRFDLST